MSRSTGTRLLAALGIAAGIASYAGAAETGVLFVKSEPDGAAIWIDGFETAHRTPRIVGDIAPGKHVVMLRLPDHTPVRRDVRVEAGTVVTVAVELQERGEDDAALTIESRPPGATVWFDAVERGTTPVKIDGIAPGKHMIVVMLDEHDIVEREVELAAGANERLRLDLVRGGGADAPARETPGGDDAAPAETATENEADEVPKTIKVNCPYCKGSGLIKTMGCARCGRTGRAQGEECSSCGGDGSVDTQCRACAGRGTVIAGGREYECRHCKGKGYPTCVACRGTGSVEKPNPAAADGPTKVCDSCKGSGFEQRLRCGFCRGQGKLDVAGGGRGERFARLFRVQPQCPLCGGDGFGPPLCKRCRGRGSFGSGDHAKICPSCMGTGHAHGPCRACRGRGYVYTK